MIELLSLKTFAIVKTYFAACTNTTSFFAFPPWYKYIPDSTTDEFGNCVPTIDLSNGLEPLWGIGLAIVEILLRVAGFLAIFYIIFAGYVYIRSTGNSEMAANAQKKLVSAIVGLLIVLVAIALVTFIGNQLT